jgi:hypothetical protein
LVVPVSRDGSFAFDLMVSMETPARGELVFENAATSEVLHEVQIVPISRQAEVIPHVERLDLPPTVPGWSHARHWILSWLTPATTFDAVLIEAARDVEGAPWFGVDMGQMSKETITQVIDKPSLSYNGPLKFRVIPISYEPRTKTAKTP